MNSQHIHQLIESLGISVQTLPHYEQKLGYYDWTTHSIWVQPGLTLREETATLAHELVHCLRGHHGHQEDTTEKKVDEEAASLLITRSEDADAERTYGEHPHTLADVLDQPAWVIEAYQRYLARTR